MKRLSLLLLFLLPVALPSRIDAQDQDPRESFAKGYALFSAGKPAEAEEHFRKSLGGNFVLEDYSLYFLGVLSSSRGRPEESRQHFLRLKQAFPLSVWSAKTELELARLSLAEGNYREAAARLRALRTLKIKKEISDESLYLLGHLHELVGEPDQAYSVYQELRRASPLSSWAAKARKEVGKLRAQQPEQFALTRVEPWLGEAELLARERDYSEAEKIYRQLLALVSEGPLRPRFLLGLANIFRAARKREEAVLPLTEIVEKYPLSPEAPAAHYRLGEIYWNRDENARALDYFKPLLERYPSGPFTDLAHVASARIYESLGSPKDAARLYREFSRRFPQSPLRDEARWRLAWVHYLQRDYGRAHSAFRRLAAGKEAGAYQTPALYWQARTAEKSGRSEEAKQIFLRILNNQEESYYKGPARQRLEKMGGAAEEKKGAEPDPAAGTAVSIDPDRLFHLSRAQELSRISLHHLAVVELNEIRNSARDSLPTKLLLMREYARNGAYGPSVALASQIPAVSDDVARHRFPLAFWEMIQKIAREKIIDPYLVLALIRQESVFDPRALSPASAYGLMQLLSSTAARMAAQLGLPSPGAAKLYDPETNLTLGIHHLRGLLQRYGDNWVKAIAAYNAGEAAVARWEKQILAEDEDEFIEQIPYRETRLYVKLVLRNHRVYRAIYEAKN